MIGMSIMYALRKCITDLMLFSAYSFIYGGALKARLVGVKVNT